MNDEQQIRVGVVGSTPLRLLGLTAILEEIRGVKAVDLELDAAAHEDGLSLLVLDLRTPIDTVLYAVARVLREQSEIRILVLCEAVEAEAVQTILAAGAKGFLSQNASEAEIKMAAQVVLDGSIWGPRKVLARLIEEKQAVEAVEPQEERVEVALSQREREVLSLLKQGRSNGEIATVLGTVETTVKSHVGKIMRKTRARSRLELALRAVGAAKES